MPTKKWKNIYLQVTLEEVNSQIALEYGQAMTVRVLKADGEVMRKSSFSVYMLFKFAKPFILFWLKKIRKIQNIQTAFFPHSDCGGAKCYGSWSEEGYSQIYGAKTATWRRRETHQLVNTQTQEWKRACLKKILFLLFPCVLCFQEICLEDVSFSISGREARRWQDEA